ncbi:hypothetical protein An13g01430 [Aspergillus niger]|uniref:Uncharacterized protein n=2 Tax=Aspergillus niger TaxID=5061 RepID=A2R1J3_ASPNC|nr:hypothetical protein An13g01430 [Aspergillus niger]CAK41543.1 hypothetical protein An13g01430 [Aspergillus niger]
MTPDLQYDHSHRPIPVQILSRPRKGPGDMRSPRLPEEQVSTSYHSEAIHKVIQSGKAGFT